MIDFWDIFSNTQAINYEAILREEEQKKSLKRAYHWDFNYDVSTVAAKSQEVGEDLEIDIDVVEILISKLYVCRVLCRLTCKFGQQ